MMKWLICQLLVLFGINLLLGQMKAASLNEDGHVMLEETNATVGGSSRSQSLQIKEGFPLRFAAHKFLKNFRNVTLHDLDGDGADEILFGILDRFYCYNGSTLQWSRPVSAIIRFPCAVGDIDDDGSDEVVVLSGYSNEPGVVYVYRADGSDYPGWPKDFGGLTKLSSPALADLDGDADLELVFGDLNGTMGAVHAVHHDGSYLSRDWPVDLPNIPAVTPSIGDIDLDGKNDIIVASTQELYAMDGEGQNLVGWPIGFSGAKFSFQSPVLADIDGDRKLEVIGTAHGDAPVFYTLRSDGTDYPGWPISIPEDSWSFHPPSVFAQEGKVRVINARPARGDNQEVIFSRDLEGKLSPGYPIRQSGGHEGISSIVDIDGDLDPDLVVSSNLISDDGDGFVVAYDLLSGDLLPSFPIRQKGLTYMNGATFGDIDGDQQLDMVCLSYSSSQGEQVDTTYIYAYDLGIPLGEMWWPTYKGSNTRDGLSVPSETTSIGDLPYMGKISISPNPSPGKFSISPSPRCPMVVIALAGEVVHRQGASDHLDLSSLSHGTYFVRFQCKDGSQHMKKVIVQ